MAAATIRLGKISSINYTAGKARVVYEDRDDSVTSELPFLALQYNIPKVDDLVVVACFSRRPWSVCSRCVPVLLFCAACSVGDQVHKIFVPGRHFDVIDLGFDAAGYVIAMLLVLLTAALVRHATRPIGAHARR